MPKPRGPVDLETLEWIWDHLAHAGPFRDSRYRSVSDGMIKSAAELGAHRALEYERIVL